MIMNNYNKPPLYIKFSGQKITLSFGVALSDLFNTVILPLIRVYSARDITTVVGWSNRHTHASAHTSATLWRGSS